MEESSLVKNGVGRKRGRPKTPTEKTQRVIAHKRRKKGGKRKCRDVGEYYRKPKRKKRK